MPLCASVNRRSRSRRQVRGPWDRLGRRDEQATIEQQLATLNGLRLPSCRLSRRAGAAPAAPFMKTCVCRELHG